MKKIVEKLAFGLLLFCLFSATLGSTKAYATASEITQQDDERLISGVVVDAQKEKLPGVKINVKGTSRGGITDLDGNFNLRVKPNEKVLIFSFIGYKTVELDITKGSIFEVVMYDDTKLLDEIVVTGYQTISKERATGSFALVNSDDIKSKLQTDILGRLEGQVPGLQRNEKGFNIRGISTLNGVATPLIVLDGLPYEGDIKNINPSTITKVTVLKDAAAASIYGARAANGVIVINTMDGSRDGKVHINYDGSIHLTRKPNYKSLNLLNTSELIDLQSSAFYLNQQNWSEVDKRYAMNPVEEALLMHKAGLLSQADLDNKLNHLKSLDNRDQLNEFFLQTGITHQHNVSVSGGNEKYRYSASLNYMGDRGTTQKNNSENIGVTLRNTMNFLPWLTADFSFSGSFDNSSSQFGGGSYLDFIYNRPSYDMLYDETGHPAYLRMEKSEEELNRLTSMGLLDEHYSPVLNRDKETSSKRTNYYRIQAGLNIKLIEDLDLDLRFQTEKSSYKFITNYANDSYHVANMINNAAQYDAEEKQINYNVPLGGQMAETRGDTNAFTFRPQLNFQKDLNDHSITALMGFEIRATKETGTRSYYMGYDEYTLGFKPVNQLDISRISGTESLSGSFLWAAQKENYLYDYDDRFISLYANTSYTFQNKLNITGSIRVDQSNLFGTDPKYQYRPLWSLGASYDISREEFLDNVDWLDFLKLRFTYGIGGNIPKNVGPYLILNAPEYNPWIDDFGSNIKSPPNNRLRWEKTATTNVGIDFAVLNNRLSGSFDFYNKNTSDLLAYRDADPTLGHEQLMLNYGSMYNRGVELSLNGLIINNDNFSWNTIFGFSYNKNKLIDVDDSNKEILGYTNGRTISKGYPYSAVFSHRYAGLSKETGEPLYFNKDGEIVDEITDIEDLVYSGTTIAPYFSSLTNSFRFYNFDLSFMFTYRGGNVLRNEAAPYMGYAPSVNVNRDILNRWNKPGDELNANTTPALVGRALDTISEVHPWKTADIHVIKGDYFKLQTLSLSYNIDKDILAKLNMESMSVTFQADNIWIIPINKKNVNPEALSLVGYGWGQKGLPISPSFNVGISATF
ncbi:SusC/RagA family TonB-linked outer membrane protein [Porphyromonadaceae bacterium W3.11]|nr:SusC/RagA family TonB-linked outer membrane protein [Porphyromonadaceae bacterium W3.11]